jgi:phage I-like protein
MSNQNELLIKIGIAACALNRTHGGRVQILPDGVFRTSDGRPSNLPGFFVKNPAQLLALAASQKNDFVIDYEHQTLNAESNGKPNPAAGWFNGAAIQYVPGEGFFAESVNWTGVAKSFIENDEYRYLSPVFEYDKKTGEVLRLLHFGLVNTPAIDGMLEAAVAAFSTALQTTPGGYPVNPELLKLLNLAEGADDAAVFAAVAALKAAHDDAGKQVAALNSAQTNQDSELLDVVKELQGEVAALKTLAAQSEVSALIEANKAKLPTPKLREWAAKQPVAALKAFLDDMPEIPALTGGTQTHHGGLPEGHTQADLWKAEFASTAALKREFADAEQYVFYKRAVANGQMGE